MFHTFSHARQALFTLALFVPAIGSSVEDAELFGREALTPDRLAAAALAGNPGVPMMQAAWRAALSSADQVSALDDPLLMYSIAPLTAGTDDRDFGFGIELSQRVPWPGKRALRGLAASHEAEAAEQDIGALRLKLASMAKGLFADWHWIHQAIAVNHRERELLKEFRAVSETRYAAGTARRQDALRADVEFTAAGHRRIVLEGERRRIAARINRLLNRPPDTPVPPPEQLSGSIAVPNVKALQAAAARRRPENRALNAKAQAFEVRSDLAQRESYPDFNLAAGYNSLWERTESRFTVGVGLNLPLNLGRRRAARDEARAALARARWALADQRAKIAEEVQIAYEGFRESREALTLFREQLLPLADDALAAAKAEYRSGGGDFLALIDAEKSAITARLQAEKALADMHRWLAELERALGGFSDGAAALQEETSHEK